MPYKVQKPGKFYKLVIGTPAFAEAFAATLSLDEMAEEVDTSQSGPDPFTDQIAGARGATLKFKIFLEETTAVKTIVGALFPGVEMENVDVLIDRAQTNKWSFPFIIILTVGAPIEFKAGAWSIDVTAKSRGPYTRPAMVGA